MASSKPAAGSNEKAEDEALRQRLARESRFLRLQENLSATGEIVKIQEEANMYLRKIEVERAKVNDLDEEIAKSQAELIEQRRKMGGSNALKDNYDMTSRQIRLLENRLDKALVKFNVSLARNKKLRADVDHMRGERVMFDGVYKKLEKELHERKKEMAALLEDSKNAYQARDQARVEMLAFKEEAEEEQLCFEREWERLGKAMEENLRLKETVGRFKPGDVAGKISPGRAHGGGAAAQAGSGDRPQTPAAVEPASPQAAASFEATFERLQAATGVGSVEELVGIFLATEDANFRLFNYVSGLHGDVERLELSMAKTKAESEAFKGLGASDDARKKKVLKDLAAKLARIQARIKEHDEKCEEAAVTMGQLKAGVQSLFTRLGRSEGEAAGGDDALGNQGVTETNMLQHLGAIEQRATEVLSRFCEDRSAAGVVAGPVGGVMPPKSSGGAALFVVPPAWEDLSDHGDDSDNNDDERPMTRGEAQRRSVKNLATASPAPRGVFP